MATRTPYRLRLLRAAALAWALIWMVAPATAPAGAQELATIERGVKPERSFDLGEVDQIRLFNGGLSMTIPIGQSYPLGLGSELSYRLNLTYSGQVWDYIQAVAPPTYLDPYVTQAHPGRVFNAGLGWRLSLGEYWDSSVSGPGRCGECYIGPDGSQHPFYQSLHPDVGDDSTDTLYTRDGTYLRLRKSAREIDFPNGEIHRFDAQGRLIQIRDRLGHVVDVSYTASSWTIDDGLRTHTVNLVDVAHYGKAVGSVVLAAFGGTTATYSFEYAQPQVKRSCLDTDPDTSSALQLPLLTKVTLPDGSSYEMPQSDYITTGPTASCDTLDYVSPQEGLIEEIKLPTRGKIGWTYQAYNFPTPIEGDEGETPPFLQKATGVKTRVMKNAVDAVQGTWTYTQLLPGGQSAVESITQVETPLGDRFDHYFRVGDEPDPLYGLPVSSVETAPGRPDLMRSLKVYDCEAGGTGCVLVRTIYLKYRTDSPFTGGPEFNARVEAEYARFHDDSDYYIARDFSDFDGLGHYRVQTVTSDFPGATTRTVRANFNPTRGTYPGSFVMPTTATPWVLETFDYQTQEEGGQTLRTDFCFDTATGFLERTRVRASTTGAIGATDLVTVFIRNDSVQQILERSYGGDLAPVGTSALCSLALGSHGYQIRKRFDAGTLRLFDYLAADNSLVLRSMNRVIDPNTGRPSLVRDTALVTTTLVYDQMGRITEIKPAEDAWVRYTYRAAITDKPRVQIRSYENGAFTALLTHEDVLFDDFGRVLRERRRMPGGFWARRSTYHDALSQVTDVSEWQSDAPNTVWSHYGDYDPFGRPEYVDPPEGSSHRVSLRYVGNRIVRRTSQIGTALAGGSVTESAVTVIERYDPHGRLRHLVDGAGTTIYARDAAGRITSVTLPGGQVRSFAYDGRGFLTSETLPEKGASGNGTLTYSRYDARGNVGRVSDGPMSVDHVYDRAARLVRTHTPAGADLKLFTYGDSSAAVDRSRGKVKTAERFNYVTLGGTPSTIRVRETYTYGGRSGRPSVRLTESFVDGVAAESFTQGFDGYDSLGNVGSLSYPQCTHAGCGAPSPRTVGFTYSFDALSAVPGWASSVTYHHNGMTASVAHANGVTVTRNNDPWFRPLPRSIATSGALNPAGTAASNWTTGTYVYDGERNVTQIGSGRFVYDTLSRLVSASLTTGLSGGAAANRSQSYVYDTLGNRTSTTTDGVSVASPASASTNRLTGAVSYDAAGNLTAWNGNVYEYDPLGNMWRYKAGSVEAVHLYTAANERVATVHVGQNRTSWTLRDLDGKVLREYQDLGGAWSVERDYVYRGNKLLAAWTPAGVRHFHLDHLGTPRLVTDSAKRRVAYHAYFPFGDEATSPTQDTERMKFTGHERDLGATAGSDPAADDLDYLHARFTNPRLGRFLSVDPGRDTDPAVPQSWNLYTYAGNNPLRFVDREGEAVETVWDAINIGIGVVSLVDNVSNGRYGAALLDAGGIVVDTLAASVPFVPGGVGTAIKAGRAGKAVTRTVRTTAKVEARVEAANDLRKLRKRLDKAQEAAAARGQRPGTPLPGDLNPRKPLDMSLEGDDLAAVVESRTLMEHTPDELLYIFENTRPGTPLPQGLKLDGEFFVFTPESVDMLRQLIGRK